MRTYHLLFGVALTIASASVVAVGCECKRPPSFELEVASSDVVFSGEVVAVASGIRDTTVTFRPISIWKGAKTESIVLATANPGKACGFEFKQGRQYLVYALSDGTTLRTSTCTRTKPAEYSYDDLAKFTQHSWSRAVNGLRARIDFLPEYHGDAPYIAVYLEIQNIADSIGPRNVRFHPRHLQLNVLELGGSEILAVEPMYNGFSRSWNESLIIPYRSSVRFKVSSPGAGYLKRDGIALDLDPLRIWRLKRGAHYFVSAKLAIPPQKDDHPFLDWSGILEMPSAIIHAVPPRSAL